MSNQQLEQPANFGKAASERPQKPIKLEQELMEISSASFAWRVALWITLMVIGGWLSLRPQAWAVVTGILRVAKENLFSGLNNLDVYTLLATQFRDSFGFTEVEGPQLTEVYNVGHPELGTLHGEATWSEAIKG